MTLTIPFGKAGMPLHTDLIGAEVLESRIGELAASGSEDDLVRARKIKGGEAHLVVIPNGISVMVR